MMDALLLLLPVALGSAWLTGRVRRYALARSLLDLPNARSSHTAPTPRGGGLAIALTSLPALALAAALGWIRWEVGAALVGGGAMVAMVGWIDDQRQLSARVRALVHGVAALWAVAWLGGLPTLSLGLESLHLGWFGTVLATVGIVWCVNLYNFMDGTDGLAGTEAVTVGGLGAGLLWLAGHGSLALAALIVAAASAGFLVWNWAPARIFMGDVGSCLLGFLFGVLALASENSGAVPLVVWAVLLGVFVFDATLTLLRRVIRGERWAEAHRSHGYQRIVQGGWSHAQVGVAVLTMNLALGALAFIGVHWPPLLPGAVLVAVAMLAGIYLLVERVRPMPTVVGHRVGI